MSAETAAALEASGDHLPTLILGLCRREDSKKGAWNAHFLPNLPRFSRFYRTNGAGPIRWEGVPMGSPEKARDSNYFSTTVPLTHNSPQGRG